MTIDIYTLIFAALAVFLAFKLRSVLGTTTGDEAERAPQPSNVVPINGEAPPFRWKGFAEEGSAVALGLDEIARDTTFNLPEFMSGAKIAYEMFTASFAKGDRASLQPHLSADVFAGFESVISSREKNGERVDYRFIGIDKATITTAGIDTVENEYEISIAFVAQAVTATFSKDNALLDGDAEKVTEIRDIWTFARKIGSPNPNWQLVGTADA